MFCQKSHISDHGPYLINCRIKGDHAHHSRPDNFWTQLLVLCTSGAGATIAIALLLLRLSTKLLSVWLKLLFVILCTLWTRLRGLGRRSTRAILQDPPGPRDYDLTCKASLLAVWHKVHSFHKRLIFISIGRRLGKNAANSTEAFTSQDWWSLTF